MIYLWFPFVVGALAFVFTGMMRYYALSRNIMDVPNARSSHSVATPRGGGVAIVLALLLTLPVLVWADSLNLNVYVSVCLAGGLIAVIGFMDDHGHIDAKWRLLGHFVAAACALYWLNFLPQIGIFGIPFNFGWFGNVLAAFYLVWMLNLYNFMDGIDGIASVEAVCACSGACLLYWIIGVENLIGLPLVLAAAVIGFLCWNFPPAKIFMGDAGSGFLGIVLGIITIQAAWVSSQLLWAWLILLGVFVVDATITLFRRLLRGDKVYEAHRSHAYQFASRYFKRHLPITLGVAAINVFWLLPMAYIVAVLGVDGVVGLIVAYLPLTIIAIKFRAGAVEETE